MRQTLQLADTIPHMIVSRYNSFGGSRCELSKKWDSHIIAGKSKVINKALTDIGMGKYQWCLFALCGFGWFADK